MIWTWKNVLAVGFGIFLYWLLFHRYESWRRERQLANLIAWGERVSLAHREGRRCENARCEYCDEKGAPRG